MNPEIYLNICTDLSKCVKTHWIMCHHASGQWLQTCGKGQFSHLSSMQESMYFICWKARLKVKRPHEQARGEDVWAWQSSNIRIIFSSCQRQDEYYSVTFSLLSNGPNLVYSLIQYFLISMSLSRAVSITGYFPRHAALAQSSLHHHMALSELYPASHHH